MRFFLNSLALLTELVPHESKIAGEKAISVAFIIYKGYLDLWSDIATTGMPIDGEHAVVTYIDLPRIMQALRMLEEQEITLDLHEFTPSMLYARQRRSKMHDWTEVRFTI